MPVVDEGIRLVCAGRPPGAPTLRHGASARGMVPATAGRGALARARRYSVTRPFPAGMVKRRKPPFASRVQTTAIVK